MVGPVTWVMDMASSAKTSLVNSVYNVTTAFTDGVSYGVGAVQSAVGNAVSGALSYLVTPWVQEKLIEGWDGFSRSLNVPAIGLSILARPKTRAVLWNALYSNMLYMSTVMIYESYGKAAMHTVPGMEDSWAEFAVDRLAHFYFLRCSIDAFVNNALNYASLNTSLSEELPVGPQFKACKHVITDGTVLGKANAMSVPYYYSSLALSEAVTIVPVVGRFLEWPIKTLVYGQSLVGYKLAAAQQCSDDRYEILARNNPYSFGFGLSFVIWNEAIPYYTGVNSPYVRDALFNFIYMYHMVVAYLIDKPLPGKRPGVDVFAYTRQATDRLIGDTVESVLPLLSGSQGDLAKKVEKAIQAPPLQLAKKVILPCKLQSCEVMMQRSDASFFSKLHKASFIKAADDILEVRGSGKVRFYKHFGRYLPESAIPQDKRMLLDNVVLHPDLRKWIRQFKEYLEKLDNYAQPVPIKSLTRRVTFIEKAVEVEQPENAVPAASAGVSFRSLGGHSHQVIRLGGGSSGRLQAASVARSSAALFAAQPATATASQEEIATPSRFDNH